jgi:hypothetical protein
MWPLIFMPIIALVGGQWFDAVVGRHRLKRYSAAHGYVVIWAHWVFPNLLRQVQLKVTPVRDGVPVTGNAYLGGFWTGLTWSRRIQFEWDDPLTSGPDDLLE